MGNASISSGRQRSITPEPSSQAICPPREICLRASDLIAGDEIVTVQLGVVRVASEPDLVHRGLSPFDQLEVLAGLWVEAIDVQGAEPSYLVFRLDQEVPIVRLTTPRHA